MRKGHEVARGVDLVLNLIDLGLRLFRFVIISVCLFVCLLLLGLRLWNANAARDGPWELPLNLSRKTIQCGRVARPIGKNTLRGFSVVARANAHRPTRSLTQNPRAHPS